MINGPPQGKEDPRGTKRPFEMLFPPVLPGLWNAPQGVLGPTAQRFQRGVPVVPTTAEWMIQGCSRDPTGGALRRGESEGDQRRIPAMQAVI